MPDGLRLRLRALKVVVVAVHIHIEHISGHTVLLPHVGKSVRVQKRLEARLERLARAVFHVVHSARIHLNCAK